MKANALLIHQHFRSHEATCTWKMALVHYCSMWLQIISNYCRTKSTKECRWSLQRITGNLH